MNMVSKRKMKKERKSFITSKVCNLMVMTAIFAMVIMITPVFADAGLDKAKEVLAMAAKAGGGLWAAWGLVQVGTGVKDHNGPAMQGGLWQLIGGAIIVAAGVFIGTVDVTFA